MLCKSIVFSHFYELCYAECSVYILYCIIHLIIYFYWNLVHWEISYNLYYIRRITFLILWIYNSNKNLLLTNWMIMSYFLRKFLEKIFLFLLLKWWVSNKYSRQSRTMIRLEIFILLVFVQEVWIKSLSTHSPNICNNFLIQFRISY